jgi:hypothetical protein
MVSSGIITPPIESLYNKNKIPHSNKVANIDNEVKIPTLKNLLLIELLIKINIIKEIMKNDPKLL